MTTTDDPKTDSETSPDPADSHSPGRSHRSSGGAAILIVILLLLIPFLYVAAIGPLVWMNERGIIHVTNDSLIAKVYYPLERLASNVDAVDQALQWYISFWEPSRWAAPPPVATPVPLPAPATTPGALPIPGPTYSPGPVPIGPPSASPATMPDDPAPPANSSD